MTEASSVPNAEPEAPTVGPQGTRPRPTLSSLATQTPVGGGGTLPAPVRAAHTGPAPGRAGGAGAEVGGPRDP